MKSIMLRTFVVAILLMLGVAFLGRGYFITSARSRNLFGNRQMWFILVSTVMEL